MNLACSIPATSSWMVRAASSMSASVARSRDIVGNGRAEDRAASIRIPASLDRRALHEVHLAPDDRLELVLGIDEIEQAPMGLRRERDEHVHVAVRAEVVAQHGAEQLESDDPPPPAVPFDAL